MAYSRYKGPYKSGDKLQLAVDYYSYAHHKFFPKGTPCIVMNTSNLDAEFGFIIIAIYDESTQMYSINEMANEKHLELQ